MKRIRFFFVNLLLCLLYEYTVAIRCWNDPVCYCKEKKRKSIYCTGVRDVSHVEGLMRSYASCTELRLYGTFKTIPSRTFDNVSIHELVMKAPLGEDIPEDALAGIRQLKTVSFNKTLYEKLPAGLSNKNFLRFESVSGVLSRIGTELQNMTLTTTINLSRNRINFIHPHAFRGTHDVKTLILFYNELVHLDPEVLEPLKSLEIINLKYNHLYTVDGCFDKLNTLKSIELYSNNLTSVDNAFHQGMWNMRKLDLGSNPGLYPTGSTFNRTMKSLSQLYLSDIGLESLDSELLEFFPNLLVLHLNRNNLTSIPNNFFIYSPSLSQLQLSDNHLKNIDALLYSGYRVSSLQLLKMDGNELTSLRLDENFQEVRHLDLSRNHIQTIQSKDLQSLLRIEDLSLSWNGLRLLEDGCFGNHRYLKFLDLSGNPLKALNGSIRNAVRLRSLNLSSTSLESLSGDEFPEDTRLLSISLRNNSLSTVYGSFRSAKFLANLDISMNNLSTLTLDSFRLLKRNHNQRPSSKIDRLWMEGNPWSCDCRLAWIADWLKNKGSQLKDDPTCFAPQHLRGKSIRSLNRTDFELSVEDCPFPCDCQCQVHDAEISTAVDCSGRELKSFPEVLPYNASIVNFSGNKLQSFDGRQVTGSEEIRVLILENNGIENVRFNLPSKLSVIRLASNNLHVLNLDEWRNLTSLSQTTLSNNPWTCNCDTWNFRTWLAENNTSVMDVDDVRCGPSEHISLRNKAILTLSQNDLCSPLPLSEIIALSVFIGVLCILCLFCYCFRQTLAACFYSLGCTCLKTSEKHDHAYDAFVLHSDDEQHTAIEIAKGLEDGKYRFRLCIPSRDIPHPRTPEQMAAYLLQCSKIIVILSRKFIDDQSGLQILETARAYSLEKSSQITIFIIQSEILQTLQLDPMLRALMKRSPCLHWGECLFWGKLVYQLPKKTAKPEEYESDEEPLMS